MQPLQTDIVPYQEKHRKQIIAVWERSARATHHFVAPADLDRYKTLVEKIDFSSFPVYCLVNANTVLGFIGTEGPRIETLFLDPAYIGYGFGSKLMNFALNELKANNVDVNEQNTNAVNFYSKFGFVAYDRTELDTQGGPYPILKMKLKSS
ncbi:GNAT family N-acetyltransferase [Mucilaginibacter sp. AW1-3]